MYGLKQRPQRKTGLLPVLLRVTTALMKLREKQLGEKMACLACISQSIEGRSKEGNSSQLLS